MSQNVDALAQDIYDAMGDEFHLMGGDDSWKPWDELSFEIKDRYRRVAHKVLPGLAELPFHG
jgi:hypothetical protein